VIQGPDLSGGKYADVLRVLGGLVASLGAEQVEIEERGTRLVVSWQRRLATEQRQYTWLHLQDLREAARQQRGERGAGAQAERVELLRTLGQELDDQRAELQQLSEEADGFRVQLQPGTPQEVRLYRFEELRRPSQERRAARA